MADTAICEQIRAFLTPKFAKQCVRLQFLYNGRQYSALFTAKHDDAGLKLVNDNKTKM